MKVLQRGEKRLAVLRHADLISFQPLGGKGSIQQQPHTQREPPRGIKPEGENLFPPLIRHGLQQAGKTRLVPKRLRRGKIELCPHTLAS